MAHCFGSWYRCLVSHYNDVIMNVMAFQITSLTIVYSTIYSWADQIKHQNSVSLAFVREMRQWLVNSPHKVYAVCKNTLMPWIHSRAYDGAVQPFAVFIPAFVRKLYCLGHTFTRWVISYLNRRTWKISITNLAKPFLLFVCVGLG